MTPGWCILFLSSLTIACSSGGLAHSPAHNRHQGQRFKIQVVGEGFPGFIHRNSTDEPPEGFLVAVIGAVCAELGMHLQLEMGVAAQTVYANYLERKSDAIITQSANYPSYYTKNQSLYGDNVDDAVKVFVETWPRGREVDLYTERTPLFLVLGPFLAHALTVLQATWHC